MGIQPIQREISRKIKEIKDKSTVTKAKEKERVKAVEQKEEIQTKEIQDIVQERPPEEENLAGVVEEDLPKQEEQLPVEEQAYQDRQKPARQATYHAIAGQQEPEKDVGGFYKRPEVKHMYKEPKHGERPIEEETSLHKRISKYLRG